MKRELITVNPSYEVLKLESMSVERSLEACSRICYKSEDKITDVSAMELCPKMVKHKHNSTLEMAVITYKVYVNSVPSVPQNAPDEYYKFFFIDNVFNKEDDKYFLVTGSVRVFREFIMKFSTNPVIGAIVLDISKRHPVLFEDLNVEDHINIPPMLLPEVEKMSVDSLESLSKRHPEVYARHRHVGVKFIVSRAVSHEIVRHRPCSFLQESQRYCRYDQDKFGNRVTFIEPTAFYEKDSPEYESWRRSMLYTEKEYLTLLDTSTPQAGRTVLPNSCKTEIIVYANLKEWGHICHLRTSPPAEPSMREVMIPLQKELGEIFSDVSFDRRDPEGYLQKGE
ncbi:MAG: FAD-dependent thymidylate synthase [Patescibacteria group bacterium]